MGRLKALSWASRILTIQLGNSLGKQIREKTKVKCYTTKTCKIHKFFQSKNDFSRIDPEEKRRRIDRGIALNNEILNLQEIKEEIVREFTNKKSELNEIENIFFFEGF